MSIYGVGMVCFNDLALTGKLTRGLESVIQDLYHALVTIRGTCATAPEDGLGLLELNLLPLDADDIPAIGSQIETEFAKDDRVKSTDAKVSVNAAGQLDMDIIVILNAGPSFALIGPIASVRVEILNNGG